MATTVPYHAGTLEPGSGGLHRVTLNLLRSDLNDVSATMLCRFLEQWCAHHCKGLWRIEHDFRRLSVFFSSDRDFILFKFSEEYDLMGSHERRAA